MKEKIKQLLSDILALLQKLEDGAGRFSGIVRWILTPVRSLVGSLQELLDAIGNPDELRRAAEAYRAFAQSMQKFADEQFTSSNLKTAGRPDKWCDRRLGYGANDTYDDEFEKQRAHLHVASTWATALADGLDAQAGVIDGYLNDFENYVYSVLAVVGGAMVAFLDPAPGAVVGVAMAVVGAINARWIMYRKLLKVTPAVISSTCEGTWPKPSFM